MAGCDKIQKVVTIGLALMMIASLALAVWVFVTPAPASAASAHPRPLMTWYDCRVERGWCNGCGFEKAVYTRYCRLCGACGGCCGWFKAGTWCDYC